MPTPMWDRLGAERRNAVLTAAENEFAEHGFSRGSLNVIARNAGVSKGSLFQYFDDKVDFFGHLVDRAGARIGAAMDAADAELDWETDFFGSLVVMLDTWTDYFERNPRDRALTVRASLEVDPETRRVITDEVLRRHLEFIRPRFETARANGWLRQNADLDAFMSLVLLVLPHLAMERTSRTVDPLFEDGAVSNQTGISRLVDVFADAFAANQHDRPTPTQHANRRPTP